MPPLNLLLLSLLGGFVFVSKWYPTKYYTLRADGYRLLFSTAVAGALLLFVASVLKIHLLPPWPRAYIWWHQIAPPEHSGKAALAMLLGCSLWLPLNLFLGDFLGKKVSSATRVGRAIKWFSDDEAVRRAIERKHDALEVFLRMSLKAEKMVSISVQSGKVYVGYLTSTYNPAFEMESISLIPAFSGHRDEDSKALILDLNYLDVYKAIQPALYNKLLDAFLAESGSQSEDRLFENVMRRLAFESQEYEIVLPIREVQSANVFHVDTYKKYFLTGAYKISSAEKDKAPISPANESTNGINAS